MKKRIVLQALFIALLSVYMTNSFGQLYFPVKGTSSAVWDSSNNRYLYAYQDISKNGTLPVYNDASIYQCDRTGKNVSIFTNLNGNLLAPSSLLIKGNNLYIADWTKIWVVSLTDGTVLDQIMAPNFVGIQDIATDGVNTLYASDAANSQIYYFNMTTKAFDTLNDPDGKIFQPTGIYYQSTPKPKLFITSFKQNSPVQCFDFTGDSFATVYLTTYQYCYSIIGDITGNYFLSDWKSTAPNSGTVYKFIGGFSTSKKFVEHLNFPADVLYQPNGDTVIIPELNSGKNTLLFAYANKDLICPLVDTAYATTATSITVMFSEPVGTISGTNKLNYTGLGNDISIALNAAKDQATVTLGTPLTPNVKKQFNIQNVKDVAGNAMWQARQIWITYVVQSVFDSYLKSGLEVNPNPVQNKFNIGYNLLQSALVTIELYDIMGKQVAEYYNGIQNPDNYELSFQLPNTITGNGVYILKATVGGQIFMSKILVNR